MWVYQHRVLPVVWWVLGCHKVPERGEGGNGGGGGVTTVSLESRGVQWGYGDTSTLIPDASAL